MIEIGSRRRNQPPPPHILFEALSEPNRVNEPAPEDALISHMRKRLNQLINANLRYTFGN